MSYRNDDQIERRLREIESEIYLQHIPKSVQTPPSRFELTRSKIQKAAKIAAFATVGFVGVWVFSTVTAYVSIVLGLMITVGIAYFGYKLFFDRRHNR